MGQTPSPPPPPSVCLDCVPALSPSGSEIRSDPSFTPAGSEGRRCEEDYFKVASCMKREKDKVSECKEEWKRFKECHGTGGR